MNVGRWAFTCRDAGQDSAEYAGHQQRPPEGSLCKAVYLTEQQRVLQDEHNRFPVCAEWQAQDEAVGGMHSEG